MKLWARNGGILAVIGLAVGIPTLALDKYADPPTKGVAEIAIENSTDRRADRAQALAGVEIKHLFKPVGAFTRQGIDVRVLRASYLVKDGVPLLEVIAEAERDGVPLKVDNPLWYVNPPTKVGCGDYRRELRNDEEIDVENFCFDPASALEEIVTQTIISQN